MENFKDLIHKNIGYKFEAGKGENEMIENISSYLIHLKFSAPLILAQACAKINGSKNMHGFSWAKINGSNISEKCMIIILRHYSGFGRYSFFVSILLTGLNPILYRGQIDPKDDAEDVMVILMSLRGHLLTL